MKASDLIKELQSIIEEKGDLSILIYEDTRGCGFLNSIDINKSFYWSHPPLGNEPRDNKEYIELSR